MGFALLPALAPLLPTPSTDSSTRNAASQTACCVAGSVAHPLRPRSRWPRAASAMDGADEDAQACSKPSWFTPGRLLLIFCTTNLMVYLDRGVIASNGVNGSPRTEQQPQGSGIQGEFGLSNAQDGLLATAFLVGLLLASPFFSEACKHTSAFKLIGIGMAAWAAAVAGCGAAPNFGTLLACRAAVGIGEASFVALASPFIDDYAPAAQKARWLAAFYLCIPVGFAAGYVYGGLVAAALGWRAAFWIEAAVMLPFVAFALTSAPLHLAGSRDAGPDPSAPRSLSDAARELARDAVAVAGHPVWRCMTAAYVAYTSVLGVFAFWGPKAGRRIYNLAGETADLYFGGVTVLTGVSGSLAGGAALDWLGATLPNAHLVCGLSNLAGGVLVLAAFGGARSFGGFLALFAAGELALFCMQAPVGAIGMWCVPPPLRPLAISLVTVLIHLLGDVPSPPLAGALQSALEDGKPPAEADQMWRLTMSLVSCLLFVSGAVFLRGACVARGAKDYRKPEELAAVAAVAQAHAGQLAAHRLPLHAADVDGGQGGGGGGGGPAAPDGAAAAAGWGGRGGGGDHEPLLPQHGSSSGSVA